VLAHLDELGPAFEIGLQPAERYFRHSELEPQAIEEESVIDGVESRRQIEANQDSDLQSLWNFPFCMQTRTG